MTEKDPNELEPGATDDLFAAAGRRPDPSVEDPSSSEPAEGDDADPDNVPEDDADRSPTADAVDEPSVTPSGESTRPFNMSIHRVSVTLYWSEKVWAQRSPSNV